MTASMWHMSPATNPSHRWVPGLNSSRTHRSTWAASASTDTPNEPEPSRGLTTTRPCRANRSVTSSGVWTRCPSAVRMPARRAMRFITALSTNLRAVAGSLPGVPSLARSSAAGSSSRSETVATRSTGCSACTAPARARTPSGSNTSVRAAKSAALPVVLPAAELSTLTRKRSGSSSGEPSSRVHTREPIRSSSRTCVRSAASVFHSSERSIRATACSARTVSGAATVYSSRTTGPLWMPSRSSGVRTDATSGHSYSSSAAVAATTRKRPGPDMTWRWIAIRPASGGATRTGRPRALSAATVTRLRRWAAS